MSVRHEGEQEGDDVGDDSAEVAVFDLISTPPSAFSCHDHKVALRA